MVNIRSAIQSDARAIATVHLESWRTTYAGIFPKAFLDSLDITNRAEMWSRVIAKASQSSDRILFVAESDGKIVGFLEGGKIREPLDGFDSELYAVYLLKSFQSQGIGTQLIGRFAEWLHSKDFKSMMLWVLDSNPSRKYYEKIGGKPLNRTKPFELQGQTFQEVGYGWAVTNLSTPVTNTVSIERPSLELYESFTRFTDEMRTNNQPLWEPYLPKPGESPESFVNRLVTREAQPEPPFVPETIYWGVVNREVVGRISLRHRLEGNLTKIGGHIGYEVRPSFRRKGIATRMLRELLQTPKAHEIGRLLLTCSPDNIASNKTIQANGGKLSGRVFVDFIGEYRNHYWIDLNNRPEAK